MLKFSQFILEEFDAIESDNIATRNIEKKSAPAPVSTNTSTGKTIFKNNAEVKNFVDKYLRHKGNTNSENEVEYNGVYILADKSFTIQAKDGYGYTLTFAKSVDNIPYYYLNGKTGSPVNDLVKTHSMKGNYKYVEDKYFNNVIRIFDILKNWKDTLSKPIEQSSKTAVAPVNKTEPVNASFIFSFDSYINEEIGKVVPLNPKRPMSADNFIRMNLSNFKEYLIGKKGVNSPFSSFVDYKEVLATMEYLLGNQKKGIPQLVDGNISIGQLIGMEGNFIKKSTYNDYRNLWSLRIKEAIDNDTVEFKKVKLNRLIKNGSTIKIVKFDNSDPKIKIEVKIQKIEEIESGEKTF